MSFLTNQVSSQKKTFQSRLVLLLISVKKLRKHPRGMGNKHAKFAIERVFPNKFFEDN